MGERDRERQRETEAETERQSEKGLKHTKGSEKKEKKNSLILKRQHKTCSKFHGKSLSAYGSIM